MSATTATRNRFRGGDSLALTKRIQARRGRKLAHSYRDELSPPRQPIEPIIFTRRDLLEIVVGVPILAALMFGLPFLLWLLAVPA